MPPLLAGTLRDAANALIAAARMIESPCVGSADSKDPSSGNVRFSDVDAARARQALGTTATLTRGQAAACLQVTPNTFDRYFRPHLTNIGPPRKPLFSRAAVEALANGKSDTETHARPRTAAPRRKTSVRDELARTPRAKELLKLIQGSKGANK
jgi:hypothetical protein